VADLNNTANYRGGIGVPDKIHRKGLEVGIFNVLIMLIVPGTPGVGSR
jgi:hypothetical protein